MVAQQKNKDISPDSAGTESAASLATNGNPGSPKSRLGMLKRSSARTKTNAAPASDPFRFQGNGVDFKGKFIGERDVTEARGDAICAEAMQLAKSAVKTSGSHKVRITLNISIEGLKIKDQKTGLILYNFPVSKISFIARDTTDARAFGFIFGTTNGKYKFYGIKTAQTADHAVLSIRDMFQVVFEMKKKQIQEVKQKQEEQQNAENLQRESNGTNASVNTANCRMDGGVAVADLLDLETELECLEQGFNQLQNFPRMPEDDYNFETQWNNSNGTTGNGNDIFGVSEYDQATNRANLTRDPFDISFVNNPTPIPTVLPFSNASFIQPNVFDAEKRFTNGTNGVAINTNGANISDPFDVSFVNSAAAHINPLRTVTDSVPKVFGTDTRYKNGCLMANGSNETKFIINGTNGTNGMSVLTNETKMATNGTYGISPPKDPFDDSFFNSNSSLRMQFPTAEIEKSTTKWNQDQRVTTLEEAFSKLVNMDQLVPSTNPVSSTRKNPFEHIINPPKMPLNALVTTTSHFH